MSLDVGPMMDTLRALARDATLSDSQRFVAAEQAIKTWLAQTSDPAEWQGKLRELDSKAAEEKVADFWIGLRAYRAQHPRPRRREKALALPFTDRTSLSILARRRAMPLPLRKPFPMPG
jgi:hypothetical protein